MPRPMHVKRVLDEALIDAGIPFLFGCFATDVLHDDQGRPCGIVMANRAGRQAVVAKTIIDASSRAQVARLCGVPFRPFTPGKRTFRRVVIGGQSRVAEELTHRVVDPPFFRPIARGAHSHDGVFGPIAKDASNADGIFRVIEYSINLPMDGNSYAAWCRADQVARSKTYHPGQQFTSDALHEVPRDRMHARATSTGPPATTPTTRSSTRRRADQRTAAAASSRPWP